MKFTYHEVSDGHLNDGKTIGWAVAGAGRVFLASFLTTAQEKALAAFPGETGEYSESVGVDLEDVPVLALGVGEYHNWLRAGKPDIDEKLALLNLVEKAKKIVMTPEQKEAQRRDFAYGNVALHNPEVTREMVDKAAEAMKKNG